MRGALGLALLLAPMAASAQAGASADDPARSYRSGANDAPIVLKRTDRIARGSDGRLYCRRDDGSTGLVASGLSGAVTRAALPPGQSRTIGGLLVGPVGQVIGQSVDRGEVTCR